MPSPSPAPQQQQEEKKKVDDIVTRLDEDDDALWEEVARNANMKNPFPTRKEDIENYLESFPLFATAMPEEVRVVITLIWSFFSFP